MKKEVFQKHETVISILLIVIYILTNSFCMQNFGEMDYRSVIINSTLSLVVILFIVKNKLGEYYGLTKFPSPKEFLYFIPLLILMSVNLWGGVQIRNTTSQITFYILFMICVGFLEEIIFRGFLFKMMAKDNVNTAMIVSSLTFGIGHIINLFNGADLIPTLIQVCYAVAGGYLFVIIFQKGRSLWPCIIAHASINALSVFGVENTISTYIAPVFLILISVSYAAYLNKKIK